MLPYMETNRKSQLEVVIRKVKEDLAGIVSLWQACVTSAAVGGQVTARA